MGQTITIAPVTRIEGHAKVTIRLDDDGKVAHGRLHVQEFRGFEGFCVGRPFWEMPAIASRICGICPTSHALAASLAGDQILAVKPPPAAQMLRRLLSLAQLILSHSLSFFHLSAPDIILGLDFDPAERNMAGLARYFPETISKGIRLRQIGQEIVNLVAGGELHPEHIVPGGLAEPLAEERRDRVAELLPEAMRLVRYALDLWREHQARFRLEIGKAGEFESLFLALVDQDGHLDHTTGRFRFVDVHGKTVIELAPEDYGQAIEETVTGDSYMKPTNYVARSAGLEAFDCYRVGPLARINVAPFHDAPLANKERLSLLSEQPTVTASLCYHPARLIEMLYAIEKMNQIVHDDRVCSRQVLARGEVVNREGIGVTEAPRGTLIHHYRVDRYGSLRELRLIVATAHNSLAIDRTITDIARQHIQGARLTEGLLNRVEHGIRIYDPCFSCATHAAGRHWLAVELAAADGKILDTAFR